MRCLQTSNWSHAPLVPTFLEPPNTIAGEAAASKFMQVHVNLMVARP